MLVKENDIKWYVLENIATMLVTAVVIGLGLYYGLGGLSLFGLSIMANINSFNTP